MKPLFAFLLFSCLLTATANINGQDLTLWNKDTLAMANTAATVATLTAEEKKVIQLINLARLNGKDFLKRVAEPYIKQNDKDDDDYVEGLYTLLRSTKGLHVLRSHEKLHMSAAHHAHDMGSKGQIGHVGSDGSTFTVRIHRFHKPVHVAEICSYGYGDALGIVMEMLIDEGVTEHNDRETLLGKTFLHVGVSIKPHKMMEFNCVMDFAVE